MHILSALTGLIVTRAAAQDIWGTQNEGVQQMWQMIRSSVYDQNDLGQGDLVSSFSAAVIGFVLPLVGGAAVLLIIYAGIKMVTGQGKEESFSEAKNITFYALAGVVLAILAATIIGYAGTFLQTMLDGN